MIPYTTIYSKLCVLELLMRRGKQIAYVSDGFEFRIVNINKWKKWCLGEDRPGGIDWQWIMKRCNDIHQQILNE